MQKLSIGNWNDFYREGIQYLNVAMNTAGKKAAFTPEILYNIIAMGIEKQIMGLLMFRGVLPENHTLRDLLNSLKTVTEVPEILSEKLIAMDGFQEICRIDFYKRKTPTDSDIREFLETGILVMSLVKKQLPC